MNARKTSLFAIGFAVLCTSQNLGSQEKPIAILHARSIDGLGGPPVEDAAELQGDGSPGYNLSVTLRKKI